MTDDDLQPTPNRPKPTFAELVDWLEGRLTREAAAALNDLQDFDDETRASVAWIEGFHRFAGQNPLPEPPPVIKQRLRQAFQRHHGTEPSQSRHVAHLTFDSRDDVIMAGVRGHNEMAEGHQRTFATKSHGVLIDVLPGESVDSTDVRIEGQVLGVESEPGVWEVRVEHPGGSLTDIHGDENGSFSIDRVPITTHTLRLSNGQLTIEIPDPLGESE